MDQQMSAQTNKDPPASLWISDRARLVYIDAIKKFKSKVLQKLFGRPEWEAEGTDVATLVYDHCVDGPAGSAASSSSGLSSLSGEIRAQEVRLYGAQCCPTGSRHVGHINEPLQMVSSASYLGDDERSGCDESVIKLKRKRRHSLSSQMKQVQQASSSSTSSNTEVVEGPPPSHTALCSTRVSLTKNQKKKMKKKRRERELKLMNVPSVEFTFDSSMNNSESGVKTDESEEKLKWVCRYLLTVWESYAAEYSLKPEDLEVKSFLTNIGNLYSEDKDETVRICSLVSASMTQDMDRVKQQVKDFKEKTSLNSDLSSLIINLLNFWIRKKKVLTQV